MTIMITGATGFIGRHLCAHLTANAQPVLAMMRKPEELPQLRQLVQSLGGNGDLVTAVSGDLDQPGLGLTSPLPGDVKAIVHLGARFGWDLDKKDARKTNVEGGLAIAELAHKLGVRLVYISGFMLENTHHLEHLGINLGDLSQTDWNRVYRNAGSYEASKLEGALKARAYAFTSAMDWVEIQPATLTGASDSGELDPTQPLFGLIDNLNSGRLSLIPGSPQHWLPLISVDALVRLITAAINADNPPTRLLALDPDTPNLMGLIGLLARPLGKSAPTRHIPKAVLALLLKIPGLARLMNTSAESLHFIQPTRYDVSQTQQFMEKQGVNLPDITDVIKTNANWFREQVLT